MATCSYCGQKLSFLKDLTTSLRTLFARQVKRHHNSPDLPLVSHKISVQQVWRNIELVITVCRHLVFAGSHHGYAVLVHQTTHTAVTDIQANLLQFFCHARPAIATQAETGLCFDVRQGDQIRPLSAAGRTASECSQTARTDTDNVTQAVHGEVAPVFLDKLKSHCFRPAKNWVAFFRISLSCLTSAPVGQI